MRTAVALSLCVVTLSACGSAAPRDSAEEFKGEERAVAAAVEGMEDAARKNEPERLCTRLLSDRLLATLKEQGTNCTTAVRDAFKDASSKDLTVDDVTISANTATAKVVSGTGSQEKTDTLELEKAGAVWRISSLKS